MKSYINQNLENNNDDMISPPLVSVVVLSYNSAPTIVETLDSIKAQTYQNLELIVSDDCSPDKKTIEIIQEWLDANGSRFVHAELVTTDKNTGVSGNVNRGVVKSHGEWIKSIAGDDLLIPTAIEEYVNFTTSHFEKIRMCVCDVEPFSAEGQVPESIISFYIDCFEKESESFEQQKKRVMTQLVFVGPAYFYSRALYDEIGGFSEKYGNAEEWPFIYKIIRGGNRIFAINKKLVRYRVQASSLCHTSDKNGLSNKKVFMGMYRHFFDHPFKDLIREGHILVAWHYALSFWSRRLQYKLKFPLLRKIIHILSLVISPLEYIKFLGLKRNKNEI